MVVLAASIVAKSGKGDFHVFISAFKQFQVAANGLRAILLFCKILMEGPITTCLTMFSTHFWCSSCVSTVC
jgi:hypothetical protein